MLSVRRPMEVVVLNCCVTDTKDALCASKMSTILAKSASDRVSRSTSHGDVRVKGCEIQWRMSKTPLAVAASEV